ncbi:MAG: inositol monophosphatase [Acidobacteria bacterium]|nr:inositol monophosphatase [Acidobacteriota bacterium]
MTFLDAPLLLETAIAAARTGGDVLMKYWRTLDPSQVSEKAPNDLVTEADRASERAILGIIHQRFPDHAILAEESGQSGLEGEERPAWIVDPLDGTTNFVHGVPHFAVSVGVVVAGQPVAGVILDPVKHDLFTAAPGQGARWNGKPCRVSRRAGLAGALLTTGFPFKAHQLLDTYLAIFHDVFLKAKAIRRPGAAALDLAYVACGIFDGFFEFQLSPWDLAAGAALVREAGGRITGMTGEDNYLETGDVVCGSPGTHAELLEIIGQYHSQWRD